MFVPPVCFLCIFTCLFTCSCMSLACCALSILQHNEAMDTRSKPTFVPRGRPFLFANLLFCLFLCLLAFLLVCLLAYLLASLFLCLPCLSCLSTLCLCHTLFAPFPSIACQLVSCLCLCMYTHEVRMYGARARSPRHKQKMQACRYKPSGNVL